MRGVKLKTKEPKSTTTVSLPAAGGHEPNEGASQLYERRVSLMTLEGSTLATWEPVETSENIRVTTVKCQQELRLCVVTDLQGKAMIELTKVR